MNRIQLRDDLLTVFNEEEMRIFCPRFGLTYDALRGKGQRDKVGVLIGYMERNGRLPELISEMLKERPHLAARYQQNKPKISETADSTLSWLDEIAAGYGPAIEEPPTLKWNSRNAPPTKMPETPPDEDPPTLTWDS